METNLMKIQSIIDFIESHLYEELSLDQLASTAGYSKYHLHRMFVSITGFTPHVYIQRRKLTEAARALVTSEQSVLDIAVCAGYESHQAFIKGFKSLYKCSPKRYRQKNEFKPLQLKFHANRSKELRGDFISDITSVFHDKIHLVGYKANTGPGFFVIAKCWNSMHKNKGFIQNRTYMSSLTAVNDYSDWDCDQKKQPAFDYYAAAEVTADTPAPKGMCTKELPSSNYVIFSFHGNREDSMQPVSEYIYNIWFPQSTCQMSDLALYDFIKYGETPDQDGAYHIEYWVPVV